MTTNRAGTDSLRLRRTLGCFPTGVIVATTLGANDVPVGLTVNSFSSVSLNPPLVLWSLARTSPSAVAFRRHPGFTLNILSAQQQSLGEQFATPAPNKFKNVTWQPGHADTPVLADCAAVIQCRTYRVDEGGDHEIFLGEVIKYDASDRKPLVFHGGQFAGIAEP